MTPAGETLEKKIRDEIGIALVKARRENCIPDIVEILAGTIASLTGGDEAKAAEFIGKLRDEKTT